MVERLLWLAFAGALGTLARYAVALYVPHKEGGFPWPPLAVNCFGALLFGCLWALADERGAVSPEVKIVVLTGFLGAFTTFSTFAYDTGALLRQEHYVIAAVNVVANNVLGIALFFVGVACGRSL